MIRAKQLQWSERPITWVTVYDAWLPGNIQVFVVRNEGPNLPWIVKASPLIHRLEDQEYPSLDDVKVACQKALDDFVQRIADAT